MGKFVVVLPIALNVIFLFMALIPENWGPVMCFIVYKAHVLHFLQKICISILMQYAYMQLDRYCIMYTLYFLYYSISLVKISHSSCSEQQNI